MIRRKFNFRHFVVITLLTSIWIHISEVFRYFVLVIPRVKAHWNHVDSVADMNWIIFGIWGIWDTVLTAMVVFFFWLYTRVFGNDLQSVMISGLLSWIFFFVLYWAGAANMGYSNWAILWITLPLSLLELLVACFIASKLYVKYERN